MANAEIVYPQDKEPNEYRYLDFCWLDEMAMGLTAGAEKHPGETWRKIPDKEHAARAIRHLAMYLIGDRSEPHLINASMRCMMAYGVARMSPAMPAAPQWVEKECAICGKVFAAKPGASKHCSDECRKVARKSYSKQPKPETGQGVEKLGAELKAARAEGVSYGKHMAAKRMRGEAEH